MFKIEPWPITLSPRPPPALSTYTHTYTPRIQMHSKSTNTDSRAHIAPVQEMVINEFWVQNKHRSFVALWHDFSHHKSQPYKYTVWWQNLKALYPFWYHPHGLFDSIVNIAKYIGYTEIGADAMFLKLHEIFIWYDSI